MVTSTIKEKKTTKINLSDFKDKMKPIGEKYMFYSSKRYTLCQMLREIYQLTDDPEIRLKCRIASRMAKCMATMVTEYKGIGWEESFYPLRENVDEGYTSSSDQCKLR